MRQKADKTSPLSTSVNAMWNAAGCLFYLGCQWVTTVLVVLFSKGYDNSGLLAYAMSIGNMFAALALYKIRTYQVSDLNNQYSSSDYIGFRVLTVALSFLLSSVYLFVTTSNVTMIITTLFYLAFKADEVFVDVLYGIEQKSERMDYIGKSQLIRGCATLVGFTVPLYFTGDLNLAIIGMTLLCVANTVLLDVRNAKLFDAVRIAFNQIKLQSLAKSCLLPTIAGFFATSIVSMVRQQYGISQGQELLGIYASIATPAVLIQAGATYLYSPLIGTLASKLLHDGMKAFKRMFLSTTLRLVVVVGLIAALFSLFGGKLLAIIYGPSIASYIWLLPWVLGATSAIALLLYINDCLLILRDGRTQIVINGLAMALVVFIGNPLINMFNMNGINLAIMGSCTPAILLGTLRILCARS